MDIDFVIIVKFIGVITLINILVIVNILFYYEFIKGDKKWLLKNLLTSWKNIKMM